MVALVLGALAGCATDDGAAPNDEVSGGGGKADDASFTLPGHDATLLAGSSEGELAVIHVGDTFTRTPIATRHTRAPLEARSDGQRFYLLYDAGSLAIVDPARGRIERTVALPASPGGFEWASPTGVWVSTRRAGTVVEVDLATGARRRTIDLRGLRNGTGSIEPRRLYRLGDHLFVQVARKRKDGRPERGAVAVIDTRTGAIAAVIELELRDAASGRVTPGLEPDLPMVWDARRELLLVTARGNRPADTGMLVRLDTTRLAIHDVVRAASGFQGAVAMAAPFETMFVLYHTSTPTSSTHLFAYDVADDGRLTSRAGTLADAFDELDALAVDDDGALAVMANACFAGICPHGSGLSFVDARTGAVLPKLMAAQLGFDPTLVVFR